MGFFNPYSEKIKEFQDFVFDGHAFKDSGPTSWRDFFEKRAARPARKRVLEIGCSNGRFLSEIAAANPDVDFVGADWKFKVLYKGAEFVSDKNLANLAFIRGRVQLIDQWFKPGDLDEIWIFFPDPWPKTAQIKNRVVQAPFLKTLHALLKPGGKIYFKTDHPGYFQWVMSIFGVREIDLLDYESMFNTMKKDRREKQFYYRRTEGSNLPKTSEETKALFNLDRYTTDFWRGSKSEEGVEAAPLYDLPLLGNRTTIFEKSFLKDQLPIYFCEFTKL